MVNTMGAVGTVENDVVEAKLSTANEKKNSSEKGASEQGPFDGHSHRFRTNQKI